MKTSITEEAIIQAIIRAHNKMADYEYASRTTQQNVETVRDLQKHCDAPGYLSEILRVSRQAEVLTECAKEAHDAIVAAVTVMKGAQFI